MKKLILAVVTWSFTSLLLPNPASAGLSAPLKSTGGGHVMFAGDLNGDGCDDLIVFPDDRANFNVALSRGDGTFRAGGTYKGPKGHLCVSTGLQDRNGDGHLDVMASSYLLHGKIKYNGGGAPYGDYTLNETTWLGNGDGTFGPRNTTSTEIKNFYILADVGPQSSSPADFDGDGEADYVGFSGQQGAGRYIGPIAISFDFENSPYDPVYFDIGGGQYLSIVAGDFNGDGWVDIVVAGATNTGQPNNELTVLLNDGAW